MRAINGAREFRTKAPGVPTSDSSYPKVAAFRDDADPTSVYEVDPDDLAKTHGPTAEFLGLSIEIVDPKTPLTDAIEGRLPWLRESDRRSFLEPRAALQNESAELGRRITRESFKK
jgi:hypothetical protein